MANIIINNLYFICGGLSLHRQGVMIFVLHVLRNKVVSQIAVFIMVYIMP